MDKIDPRVRDPIPLVHRLPQDASDDRKKDRRDKLRELAKRKQHQTDARKDEVRPEGELDNGEENEERGNRIDIQV